MRITKINGVGSYVDGEYKVYYKENNKNEKIKYLVYSRIDRIKPQLFLLKHKLLRKKRNMRLELEKINEYIWGYIDKTNYDLDINIGNINVNLIDKIIKEKFFYNKSEENIKLLKELVHEIIENSKIINEKNYLNLFEELIQSRKKQTEELERLRLSIPKTLERQDLSVNFNAESNNLYLKIKINKKDRLLLEILDEMFNNGYKVIEEKIFKPAKDLFLNLLYEKEFVKNHLSNKSNNKNYTKKLEKALDELEKIKKDKIEEILEGKSKNDSFTDKQLKELYILNKVYNLCRRRVKKIIKSKSFESEGINHEKFEKQIIGALKNNITQKILSIGKFLYYFSNIDQSDSKRISSFDLELISAVDKINLNLTTSLSQALKTLYIEYKEEDNNKNKGKNNNKYKEDILNFSENDKYNENKEKQFIKDINTKLEKIFDFKIKDISLIIFKNLYALRNALLHYERRFNYGGNFDVQSLKNSVKQIISKDINLYGELIKEKFVSNDVLKWFDSQELDKFIKDVYSSNYSNHKYIPSYNKLVKDLTFVFGINLNDDSNSQFKAKRFLLKEIYYNDFINREFNLYEALESVKKEIDYENSSFPEFEEIVRERFNSDLVNLDELARYLLEKYNLLVLERKSKNDTKGNFILHNLKILIAHSFKKHIDDNYLYIIEEKKEVEDYLFDFSKLPNPYIDLINNENIYPFYIMCKLLPAHELNILIGNIKEYIQYVESIKNNAYNLNVKLIDNKVVEGTYIYQFANEMLRVAEFCLEAFGKLISKINQLNDGEISTHNKITIDLFGYLPKYIEVKKCYRDDEVIEKPKFIEISQRTKEDLEKEINYRIYKNNKDNIEKLMLSNLYSDLYSQLLSWGVMVERDIIYFILANKYFISKNLGEVEQLRKKFMYENYGKSINTKIINEFNCNIHLKEIFDKLMFIFVSNANKNQGYTYKDFRNKLMHFNLFIHNDDIDKLLIKNKDNNTNKKIGIIHLYKIFSNEFLKYDRKLKNSITVKLKNIFKKYHLDLKFFKINNYDWSIRLDSIKYVFEYQEDGYEKNGEYYITSKCYKNGALQMLNNK